jgi:hypothetical protein
MTITLKDTPKFMESRKFFRLLGQVADSRLKGSILIEHPQNNITGISPLFSGTRPT